MHTDKFRTKYYDLKQGQETLLVPHGARLLHTFNSVHRQTADAVAVVLQYWEKTCDCRQQCTMDLMVLPDVPPSNLLPEYSVRAPHLCDSEWTRSFCPFTGRRQEIRVSPYATLVDFQYGHLVIEEPVECADQRIVREFMMFGHGEYVSDAVMSKLDYVGCWSGNNGANVLVEIYEVKTAA